MSCLYILEINPLSVASFANIFSHSQSCLFVLFMVSYVRFYTCEANKNKVLVIWYHRKEEFILLAQTISFSL